MSLTTLDTFLTLLPQAFLDLGWEPSPEQITQLGQLYQEICLSNQHLNLTRITEPQAFVEKHLWDSLSGILLSGPLRVYSQAKLIDVGTGAGFPGLPLALWAPTWQVTVLDATRKKINFIQSLLPKLGLGNVQALAERTEVLGQDPHQREQYDIAVIRAVAEASVCAEYLLPLLKVGGWAVLYRGQWTTAETEALETIGPQLGGILKTIQPAQTPWTGGERHLIYLQKENPTPARFPRPVGIPCQAPLA
ncbi:16S rRNA (guanine(527)-N(7))-methyltransferase RsmG [Synechocystis sp. LKSZ1]|uniref:16S rRNA (guanine(527)-N(7))-methyltransferase RsmG n=1 Tax=Synechocystis sp. LKSZ1 TaxID=3144951 RepID=UPI00336BCF16